MRGADLRKLSVLALSLTISAAILGGCGGNDAAKTNEPTKEATVNAATEAPVVEATATPEEVKVEEPSSPQEAVEKELSAEEKMALDYVNIYLNGTDKEAKKKFVEEQIRPDTQSIFALGQNLVPTEEEMFKNPVVIDEEDYETSGMKGKVVLVQNDAKEELIMLILEGKLGFVYKSGSDEADVKAAFDDMRALFK
jgi:hypothetical protein